MCTSISARVLECFRTACSPHEHYRAAAHVPESQWVPLAVRHGAYDRVEAAGEVEGLFRVAGNHAGVYAFFARLLQTPLDELATEAAVLEGWVHRQEMQIPAVGVDAFEMVRNIGFSFLQDVGSRWIEGAVVCWFEWKEGVGTYIVNKEEFAMHCTWFTWVDPLIVYFSSMFVVSFPLPDCNTYDLTSIRLFLSYYSCENDFAPLLPVCTEPFVPEDLNVIWKLLLLRKNDTTEAVFFPKRSSAESCNCGLIFNTC
jgi:hypothetical protein